MFKQEPGSPREEIQETHEIMKRPEYAQACNNTKHGGDLIGELLKLGVPELEVKSFALVCLEKNIRAGYGLGTVRSIARQGGVITEAEVDKLFEEIKTRMSTETPTETAEEKARREAEELAEMLKLYE
ncbi:MAG: hypothetical protein AAB390_05225 [Patescibacteria group bacterium]